MGTNYKHGFTIIETVLFLAVSSALAIGILAGSNMAINQQRYRDSVSSLQSEIQQQFSEVANVNNSHDPKWSCESSGKIVKDSGPLSPRGTSDCIVMGRYIKSYDDSGGSADGSRLYVYSVIGRLKKDPPDAVSTDTDAINNYNLRLSGFDARIKPLEWDATVRILSLPKPKQNMFSVLILRSPLTGAVRTYIPKPGKTIADADLDSKVVIDDNLTRSLKLCVDAPTGVFTGGKMAVQLSANASNQSAVETIAEGSGC